MKVATIFTDGASRGNPGPGGWGAIVSLNGEVLEIGGRESRTTNNRMELTAVVSALIGLVDGKGAKNAIVFTDSSYVLNGSTKWVHGWKRNGWMKQDKTEVLNKDLWEKMDFVLEKISVEWNLVAGHAGIAGNERCDVIATSFADDNPVDLYSGSSDKYFVDIKNIAPLAVNKDAKNRSKTKAYSYLSLVEGELEKHSTWAECESRVRGVKGAKYRKSISPEDEMQIISSWNKDIK